ncbi:hypothetical protein JTE90_005469 [Oedothorax gibbosus]|uniref:Uncharacterized protein n=1 Tax=Oedothorax gibbosus TaxID=931172 RepID=A0AAV6ULK9_9ARAC|nr:hypothetical protein JTE90_005469 [Oedothorax gibbosus]
MMFLEHSDTVQDNSTTSVLRLLPKMQHNGSPLTCRAHNPKLADSQLEDTRTLNITCGWAFLASICR